MTNYTVATLDQWVLKSQKRMGAVVKGATNDTIKRASRTSPGVLRGGKRRRGYVPRHTGILAGSLVSTLHGSTMLSQGDGGFAMVIGNMKPGDVARFAWTASYATAQHYGVKGMPGWHWITEAALRWDKTVASNVQRAKRRVK